MPPFSQKGNGIEPQLLFGLSALLAVIVFVYGYTQGILNYPSNILGRIVFYIAAMFLLFFLSSFAVYACHYTFRKCPEKIRPYLIGLIFVALGAVYALNLLPSSWHPVSFYDGFEWGYYRGYIDAEAYVGPAFDAGAEYEYEALTTPEDAQASYEYYYDWRSEKTDLWDWRDKDYNGKELFDHYGQ